VTSGSSKSLSGTWLTRLERSQGASSTPQRVTAETKEALDLFIQAGGFCQRLPEPASRTLGRRRWYSPSENSGIFGIPDRPPRMAHSKVTPKNLSHLGPGRRLEIAIREGHGPSASARFLSRTSLGCKRFELTQQPDRSCSTERTLSGRLRSTSRSVAFYFQTRIVAACVTGTSGKLTSVALHNLTVCICDAVGNSEKGRRVARPAIAPVHWTARRRSPIPCATIPAGCPAAQSAIGKPTAWSITIGINCSSS
jgi:hypothetical protein